MIAAAGRTIPVAAMAAVAVILAVTPAEAGIRRGAATPVATRVRAASCRMIALAPLCGQGTAVG